MRESCDGLEVTKLRDGSRGADVAREIEGLILDGIFRPGARLRQDDLAERLGVSRTPVREALLVLEARGLVQIETNRGAMVRRLSRRDCSETYFLRAELEGLAAELLAERLTPRELNTLEHLNEELRDCVRAVIQANAVVSDDYELRRAEAREQWVACNDRFHDFVVRECGCDRLGEMTRYLLAAVPRTITWLGIGGNTVSLQRYDDDHEELIDALRHRDGARARDVARRHVMSARHLMLEWLDSVNEGEEERRL
jgi:DNA-binding GntR family transcriptional regulator